MSREHELHLSDVHLRSEEDEDAKAAGCEVTCTTSFAFSRAVSADTQNIDTPSPTMIDEDGDICVRRKRRRRSSQMGEQVVVRHAGATMLCDVGLQVWRGALVLADYLLSPAIAHHLHDATVLDLGAGCGLTSIVAALSGAENVFCTDQHLPSLQNAAHNAIINGVGRAVRVRRLDWSDGTGPDQRSAVVSFGSKTDQMRVHSHSSKQADRMDKAKTEGATESTHWPDVPPDEFAWRASDGQLLSRCNMVLAADCVYDDKATSSLVRTIAQLLPRLPSAAVCLVALERRINFCLEGMAPRAPAAEHFECEVRAQKHLLMTRVPVATIPQHFEYARERNLEVWSLATET